jgi:DNA-binding NarL/FixJ family response regulator
VLSVRTVEMHVAGIMGKLGARSRTEAARLAAERGLLQATRP